MGERFSFFIVLVVTVFFVFFELFFQSPTIIHLSSEGDPSNSVTVTWETVSPTLTSTVEFGESIQYGDKVVGKGYPYSVSSGVLHSVKLEDLKSDTVYHYRVGDSVAGWSKDFVFRTAPVDVKNFTFTVYGDQGTTKYSEEVVGRVSMFSPVFHLHTGDLSYSNGFSGVWDQWLKVVEPVASSALYFPAVGNHEFEDGLDLYLRLFSLPGNERWYSFNWGNTHFVSLDIVSEFDLGGDQYSWLVNDLEKVSVDPGIDWVIVFFHYPPFTSGRYSPGVTDLRLVLVPLLERYGVDLVLSGHDHIYQRTFPIIGDNVISTETGHYVDPDGIIYLVTGGGGRSLYDFVGSEPVWSAKRESTYHFLVVSVDGLDLSVKAVRAVDGSVFDEFSVSKSGV